MSSLCLLHVHERSSFFHCLDSAVADDLAAGEVAVDANGSRCHGDPADPGPGPAAWAPQGDPAMPTRPVESNGV